MSLTIAGTDMTSRLINGGTVTSADITNIFGMIAKEKTYTLRDYDDYLNPFAAEGFFNLTGFRGLEITESDSTGLVTFRGTIQNVQETDGQECIVTAAEPLVLFLDWPVEASDRDTHAGFTVNGATASGQTVPLSGGSTTIPVGCVVWFLDSKVPSYMVTAVSPASGTTTSITLDRPLEAPLVNMAEVTVSVPAETTGPRELKNALSTSNPDILLDGTFDILHASDNESGYTVIINVMEQDNIALREHIGTITEMCDLILTQKSDGYYTVRRGLEWDRLSISDSLSGAEICGPVEPAFDDTKLVIGYDLIYRQTDNVAALLQADINPAYVTKYRGIKNWQPNKTASSFRDIRYMYASASSAEYFGERRLSYYGEPKTVINCTCKPAYNDDADRSINLYLGKQVRTTVRRFSSVPAIVVGYEYSEEKQMYTRLSLQLNTGIGRPVALITYITCVDGESLTGVDGSLIKAA